MVVRRYGLWMGMVFYDEKEKEKESWCQIFFYHSLDSIFSHYLINNKDSQLIQEYHLKLQSILNMERWNKVIRL